jgi:hypothetical protein
MRHLGDRLGIALLAVVPAKAGTRYLKAVIAGLDPAIHQSS